jgi:hypothetical protein
MNPNLSFCLEMGNEKEMGVVQKWKNPKSATSTQIKSSYEGIIPLLLLTTFENKKIQMFK